jgi:hypothetical protein
MQKSSFRLGLCPFLRNVLLPVENNQILARVQIVGINGGIMNALVDTQSKRTRGQPFSPLLNHFVSTDAFMAPVSPHIEW